MMTITKDSTEKLKTKVIRKVKREKPKRRK